MFQISGSEIVYAKFCYDVDRCETFDEVSTVVGRTIKEYQKWAITALSKRLEMDHPRLMGEKKAYAAGMLSEYLRPHRRVRT